MPLPPSPLKFSESRIALKEAVTILPVFSDQSPESIVKDLGDKELLTKISYIMNSRTFRSLPGEILNYSADRFMLAGLGKQRNFQPETAAALFRKLGALIVRDNKTHYNIVFSDELKEILEEYFAQAENPDAALEEFLKSQPVKKKKKKTTGKKSEISDLEEEEDEEGDIPDFYARISWEELLSQAITNMIIGADSMDVLKKVRAARRPRELLTGIVCNSPVGIRLREIIDRGTSIGRLLNGARYAASLPGNFFNPESAEKYAREVAREFKLTVKTFKTEELKKLGCGGILSVGRGSRIPPRMMVFEYKPAKASYKGVAVLVGKGVTFDTGGISIKPSASMHEMKYDMCGAALAIHGIALAAARKLPLRVVSLIGLAENMPGGEAIKPGDVYTAYNGMTVEVQNTDAEGRLILGDVLSYAAEKYKPTYMIDFATLTGACVISLGHDASGVMTNSEDLARRIDEASRKSMDRSWRLPHWSLYGTGLKSEVADLRNIGSRAGGTLSANRFLAGFVPPQIKWAHVDIAGTAWRDKASGTQCRGATGWGMRLINQFFEDLLS